MTPFRSPDSEIRRFRARIFVATGFALACFGVLLTRFVWLQVFQHADLYEQAESNRISLVPVPANRGLIRDRNGVILSQNFSAYTLEINPRQVANVNETIDALASVIEIHARDRRRFKQLLDEFKGSESIPIRNQLSDAEVARFAAHRFRFPGVELRARLFRNYPLGRTASHVIGYIGRISPAEKERIASLDEADRYLGADHIGKTGLELSYQSELMGTAGIAQVEITAGGRPVRTLDRTASTPGTSLNLSIDIKLQRVVEQAFGDRRGALIAIEPETGEVLAFVSMPTYDPNLFVDGIDPVSWDELNNNPDKPLLNRAMRGTYPIGSTYKPFLALAVLQTGKRRPDSTIVDRGFFEFGNRKFRDSNKVPLGVVDLRTSIVRSSDIYYYMLAHDMGVELIHDQMKPWGFGQITGIDLIGEQTGVLPSPEWKLKRFKQKWYPGETISIGIGQGYNAFTLLQVAHATAALANDGVVNRPHLVRSVEDVVTGETKTTPAGDSYRIDVKPEHIAFVRDAMVDVNISGTGRLAFAGAPYKVAGKTGTAQVVGIKQNEKYNASRVRERNRDHSLFIAFAPAGRGEKPKIALALIVENGGFGAMAAAPIARQALDYYLLGKVPAGAAELFSDMDSELPDDDAEPGSGDAQ
jgi:penicillin-binding protein 2